MNPAPGSPFGPLRHRAFAMLWAAALLGNVGTWFRDVANGWTMTELAPSPAMVALVQAASTLPVFLLSLPAGALADLMDRRRLLLGIQVWLIGVSVALAAVQTLGLMTPVVLLVLAAAGGIGAALMGPSWQAIVPELVPREDMRPAIALNSLGINIARAIAPGIGGLIVATAGPAVAYWLDAASYLPVILALLLWRRVASAPRTAPERFVPAMGTGLRFVLHSPAIRRVMARSAAFFLFASAYWALLPLIARQLLGGDAGLFGAMLGAIGLGAVLGALALPAVSRRAGPDQVVLGATALTGVATATIATAASAPLVLIALVLAGAAWIAALTTLNVAAQTVLPNWVRARGLAVYITVFFGSMTFGSIAWGQAATLIGIGPALVAAAAGGAVAGLALLGVRLPRGEADLTPSMHWPEPATSEDIPGERGPVMITIEYLVQPCDRVEFLNLARQYSSERLRDGGYGWGIFADAEDAGRLREVFYAPSWLDHLRQHERVTRADEQLQRRLNQFHRGPEPPRVTHWVAARPGDVGPPAALAAKDRDVP